MRRTLSALTLLFSGLFAALPASAGAPKVTVRPTARIMQKVDVTQRTTLTGSVPVILSRLTDAGRVSGSTPVKHVFMVLKASDEQERELLSLLDTQQDKSSANYHQWLTPETFGASFGVEQSDIEQIKAWLQSSGLTVNNVSKSGRIIDFGGDVAHVEKAFGTEIHNYSIHGELRPSNATEISIPAALAPVIAGANLTNFRATPNMVNPRVVKTVPNKTGSSPAYTYSDGTHYVGAADLAVIYNTNPLLNAGITGRGIKLALLGETDILLSDIQTYRRIFNLPQNPPNFIVVGTDPGTSAGNDGESDLDVEVAGAMAPEATIDFVLSSNGYYDGGVDSSAEYVVENNTDDIMSLSYGECEWQLQAAGNLFYQEVWEQAAAQGQSVFVSTGDGSVDACQSDNSAFATEGYSVSGLASTPFNVAVGGTMFNDGLSLGPTSYWSGTNSSVQETALSYIPEMPWNEGAFDPYGPYDPVNNPTGGFSSFGEGIVGGASGVSSYYATPAWQTGPGVPTADPTLPVTKYNTNVVPGPHRYLPDVSMEAAADHDGLFFCTEGSCVLDDAGDVLAFEAVGGTSVAAPSMAGVQALIDQKNGGRQGNPNYYYYRVAAAQSTTACDSDTYIKTSVTTCGFHDIQTGNNYIPTSAAYVSTAEIGFAATPGYDLAIGLGSPDVTNLANAWPKVSFNATTTTLTITPTTSAHGVVLNDSIKVTPVSGATTPAPTGDVSIIANAVYGGVGYYTLTAANGGIINGTLAGLPGGTYTVVARYAGDTVYGGSTSAPVTVTISPEVPTVVAATYLTRPPTASTTFTYGNTIYIQAGVGPSTSVYGIPSGAITFTLTSPGMTLPPVSANLDPNGGQVGTTYYPAGAYLVSGPTNARTTPNYPLLAPGVYTAVVSYPGDQTFSAKSSTPITFTVGLAASTLALHASQTDLSSGANLGLTGTVTQIVGGAVPGGSITFTDTTTATALGTCTVAAITAAASCTINTTKITTAGSHTITAVYAGDGVYYGTATTTTTVTVVTGTSTTTLAASALAIQVLAPETLTVTVPATTTGTSTVNILDNGAYLAAATVAKSATSVVYSTVALTAGTHVITASWAGNATTPGSVSAPVTIVVSKNTPNLYLTGPSQAAPNAPVALSVAFIPNPLNLNAAQTAYAAAVPAPTGLITYYDGATAIGTAPIVYFSADLVYDAQLTTTALGVGKHVITAVYPGDANYAAETSDPNTITVAPIGVTMSASPSTLNIPRGQAGLETVTLNTTGGWTGTVVISSCSGLPQYSFCNLGTTSVTFTGATNTQTQSVVISVATTAPTPEYAGGLLWIPALFFAGFLLVRRKQLSGRTRSLIALAVIFCGVVALSGCSTNITRTGIQNGTPVGLDTITVNATATGVSSMYPSSTLTAPFVINVTP